MLTCFEAPKATLIYVFRINSPEHSDCLKIGETSLPDDCVDALNVQPNSKILNAAARKRIDQYTQTACISYELLYTESAMFTRGRTFGHFNDKDVHRVLLRSGVKRKEFLNRDSQGSEWFCTDLETAKRAIRAVKEGHDSLSSQEVTIRQSPVVFRPEQRAAIDKTLKRFKLGHQMLWNAKMRFGKTLSALQVIKELNASRTIILTHRPVVDSGWFEDFQKIFYDRTDYHYGSKNNGETFDNLEQLYQKKKIHYIYFASMQDLRGSEMVGGKFNKNDAVFSAEWDFVIVDEAHEGTQTALGKAVLNELIKKNKTKVLQLSGTPFNLLEDYKEEEIYTWDYVMEQQAKKSWDETHFGDPNPYACLPKLNIYTYDLSRIISKYADEDIAFNFQIFRVREDGHFVNKRDVQAFLNLLSYEDSESKYPFSNRKFRDIFRHTLWIVPGVKAAKALSRMLKEHPIFQHFEIVNVAGNGDDDEESGNALSMVESAIGDNPEDTRTITLSCGRLTTGVSVPAWTGVFMLAGSFNTDAKAYMQTIFRVQTPATINGKVKEECYVFDFAPDRTLQVLASVPKVSTKAGKTTDNQKQALGKFLNFCPVISVSGSSMKALDVPHMLQQLKKAYVERAVRNGFEDVCLYNDELLKLTDLEIKEFKDLKGIIGATKSTGNAGNIDINKQGLTNEEYEEKEKLSGKPRKELTEAEKARLAELKNKNKIKQDAISILRGISIRMPLLIYGADIKNEDEELTIDNFTSLIDPQSWEEFMPRGVTKHTFNRFKKYYDAEIFAAAGKRIRAITRAADKLPIEERIARISTIFGTFRNPDKETVLTPWRVVNRHLGDTFGGYNFYNETYSTEIEEPRYINHGERTNKVFSTHTRLLEINSKSGLYPLYLAYSVYRRRLQERMFPAETLEENLIEWDKTIAQNLFIICKTPMAKAITRRTLMGFRAGKLNAHCFDDLINQIENKSTVFITKVRRGRSFWKANQDDYMKFNAIVGNPPYQLNDGGEAADDAAKPIYDDFVKITKSFNPSYFSLIIPSKWMVGGRQKLIPFRKNMMEDNHISDLFDFEDAGECFTGQHIDGGICYFVWSSQYCNQMLYSYKPSNNSVYVSQRTLKDGNQNIIIRDARRIPLITKTSKGKRFSDIVSKTKPYGIRKDIFNKSERHTEAAISSTPFPTSVLIWGVQGIKGGAKRKSAYIKREYIKKNRESIDKWKLFFTTSFSAGAIEPPEIIAAEPGTVCTETFLEVGPFVSKEERDNCLDFMKSRFFKVLLYFAKGTMQVNQDTFSMIPLLDFKKRWNNENLKKLFNLSESDINYIDKHFK